ncbi:MAG: tyrosine-type recombinase/integrase [Candidatus Eremiobacteraeota bacterium]|nr:tyrosine-type recombinase/integrase [Candidatus Eremiobacteraeota bacterium]MBC5821276.1 tyrosine-type recombinase/integrase [Candidatus Eremiobacteraeota bacterium]
MTALAYQSAPPAGTPGAELWATQAYEYARSSQAANTLRAYASDLRDFEAFCDRGVFRSFPAEPLTVAMYVAELASRAKVSTIRRRLAAIAVQHRRAGLDSPASHRIVRDVVRGVARQNGVATVRKDAVTLDTLRALVLAVEGDDVAARRDRAILLLGFGAALRRSEIAALHVEDLRFSKRGLIVHIRRSKTDQLGEGAELAVPIVATPALCAVRALRRYLDAAQFTSGPLFRSLTPKRRFTEHAIRGRDVAELVKRLAARARVDGDFSGHSLRAGFATSAAAAKVSLDAIARTTRHKSLGVLLTYVRPAQAFDDVALSAMIQ